MNIIQFHQYLALWPYAICHYFKSQESQSPCPCQIVDFLNFTFSIFHNRWSYLTSVLLAKLTPSDVDCWLISHMTTSYTSIVTHLINVDRIKVWFKSTIAMLIFDEKSKWIKRTQIQNSNLSCEFNFFPQWYVRN